MLSGLGGALVLYDAALLALMLVGYVALADRLVSGAFMAGLSATNAEQARFALIEVVAALRAIDPLQWVALAVDAGCDGGPESFR